MPPEKLLKLYGGPLDGEFVGESQLVDGVVRLEVSREKYRACPDSPLFFEWRIAGKGDVVELTESYELREGRLYHRDWPKSLDKAA